MNPIVISYPYNIKNELDAIIKLLEEGLTDLHLRKPKMDYHQYKSFLNSIPKEFHKHITLHHHFKLALEYDVKGIYFRKNKIDQFSCFAEYPCQKAAMASSLNDAVYLDKNYPLSYILLGPIFNSISRLDLYSRYSIESLYTFLQDQSINTQIVGIGGMDIQKSKIAHQIGFNGVALLGCIWLPFFESRNVQQVANIYNEIKNVYDSKSNLFFLEPYFSMN